MVLKFFNKVLSKVKKNTIHRAGPLRGVPFLETHDGPIAFITSYCLPTRWNDLAVVVRRLK